MEMLDKHRTMYTLVWLKRVPGSACKACMQTGRCEIFTCNFCSELVKAESFK